MSFHDFLKIWNIDAFSRSLGCRSRKTLQNMRFSQKSASRQPTFNHILTIWCCYDFDIRTIFYCVLFSICAFSSFASFKNIMLIQIFWFQNLHPGASASASGGPSCRQCRAAAGSAVRARRYGASYSARLRRENTQKQCNVPTARPESLFAKYRRGCNNLR